MFGMLDKRSGSLYVYQSRFFVREKNLLHYFLKRADKNPRGSIDLYNLSAITLIEPTSNASSQLDPATTNSRAREFMLTVGTRNYVLRASDQYVRQAWVEELNVWVKVTSLDDFVPIPKLTLRGLLRAIDYCIVFCTTTEGLFRVPGSKHAVENICQGIYIQGEKFFVGDVTSDPVFDVLEVGSAVKKVLRDLPENIFTNKLVPSFRSASDRDSVVELMKLLPSENFYVLGKLVQLWEALCKNEQVTKMTPINLAISFGPSISESDSLSSTGFGQLFEALISQRSEIFAAFPELDLHSLSRFNVSTFVTPGVGGNAGFRQSLRNSVWAAGTLTRPSSVGGDLDQKEVFSDDDDIMETVKEQSHVDTGKSKNVKMTLETLWVGLNGKDDSYQRSVDNLLQLADMVVSDGILVSPSNLSEDKELEEYNEEHNNAEDLLEFERKKSRLLAARVIELETMVALLSNATRTSLAVAAASNRKRR